MRKLSDKKIKDLQAKGLIVKKIPKIKKKTEPGPQTIESSLQEISGYVKTIITKKDNVEIAIESASKVSKVLDLTVKKLSELKPAGQILEWDITVERDRDDFIESMNLKAVVEV